MLNKRILSVILAISMLLLCLSACTKNKSIEKDQDVEMYNLQQQNNVSDNFDETKKIKQDVENKNETSEWKVISVKDEGKSTVLEIADEEKSDTMEVQIGTADYGEIIPQLSEDLPIEVPSRESTNLNEPEESILDKNNDFQVSTSKVQAVENYEDYKKLSANERLLFYYSFANADEFWEWYNTAKAECESNSNEIIIGDDGTVNLEE